MLKTSTGVKKEFKKWLLIRSENQSLQGYFFPSPLFDLKKLQRYSGQHKNKKFRMFYQAIPN